MKLKKITALFLCITFILTMAGCDTPEESLSGTVGNLKSAGTPATEYSRNGLGYGYNILNSSYFGANCINCNCPVLDTAKLCADKLIYTQLENQDGETKALCLAGTSTKSYASELTTKLSVQVGGSAFKGSVSNSFSLNQNQQYSSTDSFVTTFISKTVRDDYISLSKIDKLKKYMTDQFKEDINNPDKSPDELFSDYGTHVILNALFGGRMELHFKYKNTNQVSQKTLEDKAEASYYYVKGSTDVKYEQEAKSLEQNSYLKVDLLGGQNVDLGDLTDIRSAYTGWFQSIDDGADLSFVGVNKLIDENITLDSAKGIYDNLNKNSLWPIWEFADSPERQQTLKKYYGDKLTANGTAIFDMQPAEYVKDIYFGISNSKNNANEEAKSILTSLLQNAGDKVDKLPLDFDLNDRARSGGDRRYHIYMGYTLTTNPNEAIRDLKLDYRKNNKRKDLVDTKNYNNVSYNKYPLDLTKGTGGDYYICLYASKDASAGEPLKAIGLEFGNNNYPFCQDSNMDGWTSVGVFNDNKKVRSIEYLKMNVNKDTGGTGIFIWKKR